MSPYGQFIIAMMDIFNQPKRRSFMKNIVKLFLFGFLLQFSHGKNLEIVSSTSLSNFELLDVHIAGSHAFIPGGLGGLNIVNISQPDNISVIGDFYAVGCDYGRIYSWVTRGNYAYGNGRECGVHIANISNLSDPTHVGVYGAVNTRYEHASIQENTLFFSTHQMGVDVVSAEDPIHLTRKSIIQTQNAWATYPEEDFLYIADGMSGLIIANISDLENPYIISEIPTSGSAKDLVKKGNYLFMAVGADGVDMFDVSNPESPLLLSNYNTSGFATRVDANDSLVVVADWDDIEVLGYESGELILKGYKNTGGRVMATAMINNTIFSAEWAHLSVFEYKSITGADMDISSHRVDFPRVGLNESLTLNFSIENNGSIPLVINPSVSSNSNFSYALDYLEIYPGESSQVHITYSPESSNWTENILLETNDYDESELTIFVRGNYPYGPMPGDPAPNFELASVNEYGHISKSDLMGSPTVLAFFTAW